MRIMESWTHRIKERWRDATASTQALIVLSLLTILFYKHINAVLTIWFVLGGCVLCKSLVCSDTVLPNLIWWYNRKKRPPNTKDDELALLKKICPVCGRSNCSRHRPELNIVALQPWRNLKVPERVDTAFEEFLDIVLKEFIYTWYRDLSDNEAFLDEIRSSLRFITAVIVRRLKKIDFPTLVTQKILKSAIKHLHFYLQVKDAHSIDITEPMIRHYDTHLHCALRNRQSELSYLCSIITQCFPFLLPVNSLNCRSLCVLLRELIAGAIILPLMDKLADPDMVNNLLLIFFDTTPAEECKDPLTPDVEVLKHFAQPLSQNTSLVENHSLHVKLQDILKDPEALYPFMQFMKQEASVNVLQFYLSVEEFNRKILVPELDQKNLDELHMELKNLFIMYIDPKAIDTIQFDNEIVDSLREVCDGPPDNVIKLQTSTPLFRAYDHAYDLLENTFLPLFHQSDNYYRLLCGERLPMSFPKTLSRSGSKKMDMLSIASIGSKIKGVFRTASAVEGKLLQDDIDIAEEIDDDDTLRGDNGLTELLCGTSNHTNASEASSPIKKSVVPLHDLSAWRLTIPGVISKQDPESTSIRSIYTYLIQIRRLDVLDSKDDFENSNWTVERKYNELYVLEQKLMEFHGEFEEVHLPPKKSFGTKNRDFLESKQLIIEKYLQDLLTIPKLKCSELLYGFLTSEEEFTTSFLPDINLGKMVKTGAMKLVKEKGQHLETFLLDLVSSTETAKAKPSKSDPDADTISISSEKMSNAMYDNNANMSTSTLHNSPRTPIVMFPGFDLHINGIYDVVLYLAEYIFNAPEWFYNVLTVGRILFRNTLDSYIDYYIQYKIDEACREHTLESLIHLLRDALFFDNEPPRMDIDFRERRAETLKELRNYIPKPFVNAVGVENHLQGTKLVLDLLQKPKLNKQLSYMLLDDLLQELFPEIVFQRNMNLDSAGSSTAPTPVNARDNGILTDIEKNIAANLPTSGRVSNDVKCDVTKSGDKTTSDI